MLESAMLCPVCAGDASERIETKRSLFFRCPRCAFVFLDPSRRPSEREARDRYALHRNDPSDPGYVSFLSAAIDRALAAAGPRARRVVDWGSGPTAVAGALLRERGLSVDCWDPLYAPEPAPPEDSYDLALCVEVAEHFFDPPADFSALASRLKGGGVLALHTHLVPADAEAFRSWWYKEDSTHVSFYSEAALRRLARACSLEPLAFERGRLALFRRPLPVLVAGGAAWDAEGRPFAPLARGDSNPGSIRFSPGGAARNVAENLRSLSLPVQFVSVVGEDAAGAELRGSCVREGIGVAGVASDPAGASAAYLSILEADGEVSVALAGMDIFDRFGPAEILAAADRAAAEARSASLAIDGASGNEEPFSALVIDGNLRPDAAEALLDRWAGIPAWFDPVSAAKAARFGAYRSGRLIGRFAGMKPNEAEAAALLGAAPEGRTAIERARRAASLLRRRGAGIIYVSLGAEGVVWEDGASAGLFRPPPVPIRSTTGAGDAFLAALVRGAVLGVHGRPAAVRASAAAALALGSASACPAELSAAALESIADRLEEGEGFAG